MSNIVTVSEVQEYVLLWQHMNTILAELCLYITRTYYVVLSGYEHKLQDLCNTYFLILSA